MDIEKLLRQILEKYGTAAADSRTLAAIAKKVTKGGGNYPDAQRYAIETGELLTDALQEYLPEALTDGRLFRATAEVLVQKPMERAGRDVTKIAAEIQENLNQAAGIGIKGIEPELNKDQITGIITGICNADSYEAGKDEMFTQIGNFMEGTVDDCVRENADFQYRAGLNPKIERRADGKCCAWCSRLAGTYDYADVRDRGNDVFRRHKNCHCTISYNPGDGSRRRQNVHSRQWTEEGRDDRIQKSKIIDLDLQKFAYKKGDYRRAVFGRNWQDGSLKESIRRFAKGAKPEKRKRGKTYYTSKDGKISVVYDRNGDYFRILDRVAENNKEPKPYLDSNGNRVFSEELTHFINTDRKEAQP